MKINPLYKLGIKKLNDDEFLEIIKNIGPKDIDVLCSINKDFKERCNKYNKYICKYGLKNIGFKNLEDLDPCEIFKFIRKSNPSFDNIYLLYAHSILQNKSDYIDLLNKNSDVKYEEAEEIGDWISEVIDEYLPIDINRTWRFKIGSDEFDFRNYIFGSKTIISAIKENKQDDVFEMLEYLQSENLPIHHEYDWYMEAAKPNKELYNKLKQYYADIDIYSDDDDY
jgi:hypothetical protein